MVTIIAVALQCTHILHAYFWLFWEGKTLEYMCYLHMYFSIIAIKREIKLLLS